MTIGDSFKIAINNVFANTIFLKRDDDFVLKMLSSTVRGSNNVTLLPPVQNFGRLERIDNTHDEVLFEFDDYSFKGVITWRPCSNGQNMVFVKIE